MGFEEVMLVDERVWFDGLELGLGVWSGVYGGTEGRWLRWYDWAGNWIMTQAERIETEADRTEAERLRAEAEAQRAKTEAKRADRAEDRAERLAARLRELGIEE